tara:strand:- start:443 stop:892 length:450 start_codon:yes stop_codon:yes gene_type:complete
MSDYLIKTKVRHIGLVVRDLEKSLKFWCEILGFSIENIMEEKGQHLDLMMGLPNVNVTTAKLSDKNGSLIELLYFKNYSDDNDLVKHPYSKGLTHIALTVDNLEKTIGKLKKLNLIDPNIPVTSPDGKVKVVYAKCHEGLLIEFVQELS